MCFVLLCFFVGVCLFEGHLRCFWSVEFADLLDSCCECGPGPRGRRCLFHRQAQSLKRVLRVALSTVLYMYLTDVHLDLSRSEHSTLKSLLTHFYPRTPPSPAISTS